MDQLAIVVSHPAIVTVTSRDVVYELAGSRYGTVVSCSSILPFAVVDSPEIVVRVAGVLSMTLGQ